MDRKTLREMRKEAGLTQTDLADEIGFSKSAISKYESRQRTPNIYTLERLAYVLDVDILDLIECFPRQRK